MPGKRHSPEQVLRKLREVEVALSQGETVARAVRHIAVTEQPTIDGKRARWSFDRPDEEAQETRTRECKTHVSCCRSHTGQADPERNGRGTNITSGTGYGVRSGSRLSNAA